MKHPMVPMLLRCGYFKFILLFLDRIGKAVAGNNDVVGMIEESIEGEGNLLYDKVANR
jgi:hypothetical protein